MSSIDNMQLSIAISSYFKALSSMSASFKSCLIKWLRARTFTGKTERPDGLKEVEEGRFEKHDEPTFGCYWFSSLCPDENIYFFVDSASFTCQRNVQSNSSFWATPWSSSAVEGSTSSQSLKLYHTRKRWCRCLLLQTIVSSFLLKVLPTQISALGGCRREELRCHVHGERCLPTYWR